MIVSLITTLSRLLSNLTIYLAAMLANMQCLLSLSLSLSLSSSPATQWLGSQSINYNIIYQSSVGPNLYLTDIKCCAIPTIFLTGSVYATLLAQFINFITTQTWQSISGLIRINLFTNIFLTASSRHQMAGLESEPAQSQCRGQYSLLSTPHSPKKSLNSRHSFWRINQPFFQATFARYFDRQLTWAVGADRTQVYKCSAGTEYQ